MRVAKVLESLCHLRGLALAFIAQNCVVKLFGQRHLRGFANSKGADQLAHPRSLINVFAVRLWVNSSTFNCRGVHCVKQGCLANSEKTAIIEIEKKGANKMCRSS